MYAFLQRLQGRREENSPAKFETIVFSSRNLFTSFLENGRCIGYQSPSSQRAAESLFDM